jgi:LuxR family transcriptional regulator, maltose regulon positive regulatory protein
MFAKTAGGEFMDALPPVRIYTLGCFTVFMHDMPLRFNGRVQRKPLDLLRCLIAFGGRAVATARLAQALWPDTDGDMAKHALETTLYRLRKLLGDRCIEMNGCQLTLNPEHCWVDLWSVERLLDLDDAALSPAARAQQLLKLYRGSFLDGDDTPSALIQRERLHSKFVRVIGQLGRILESHNDRESAIGCYQQGIETDPLAENLYRRLMQCYIKLGRYAEALAVYQRCYKTLTTVLGVEPAPQTMELYREIQGGQARAYA